MKRDDKLVPMPMLAAHRADVGQGRFGGTNKSDGTAHTVIPPHSRDPKTGRLSGIKHGPCSACGRRRIISSITLLCGVRSCVAQRQRKFDKRKADRRASSWRSGEKATA